MEKAETCIFSIYCPYLDKEITLHKGTWHGHIIPSHAEMRGRLELVEKILKSKKDKTCKIYRKKRNHNKISVFVKCLHFKPYGNYLKIGLKIIDKKNMVVTTAHSHYDLPKIKDMEEMK